MARKHAKLLAVLMAAVLLVSAMAAFSSFAAQDYNLTVTGGNVSVMAGDKNLGEAGTHATVDNGTSVTLTANGDGFLFYMDANGNVVSEEAVYSFTMRGYQYIEAVYTVAGKTTVLYQNTNETKSVLGSAVYSSADDFTDHLAATAQNFGYEFDSWNKSVDDVKAAIANGDALVIVNPVYDAVGEKFEITAVGGTVNGATSGRFPIRGTVKLDAAAPEAGKVFSHWENSAGFPISTKSYVSVAVTGAETFTAVFVNEGELPALSAATMAKLVAIDATTYDVHAARFAPDGMTVVSYGILYAKSNSLTQDDLTVEKADGTTVMKTAGASDAPAGTVVYHANEAADLIVRPYLIVKGTDGVETTVYGDAVTAHHYASELTVVPATCTTAGEQYYACTDVDCTAKKGYETLPIIEHPYAHTPVNEPAGCGKTGNYEYWFCDMCGEYFMEENGEKVVVDQSATVWAKEHNVTYTYQNNATCLQNGTEEGICLNCQETVSREVAGTKLVHSYSDTLTVIEAATCVKDGFSAKVCTGNSEDGSPVECGAYDEASKTVIPVDPTAHSFGEYTVHEAATCEKAGTKIATCQNEGCGVTDIIENAEDPKKEHAPSASYQIITVPTSDAVGQAAKTCTMCNTVITGTELELAKRPAVGATAEGVINGTAITVNASAAGIYRVIFSGAYATESANSGYFTIYNNALGTATMSKNRVPQNGDIAEYPLYVYLNAGENTLTYSGKTPTTATFTQMIGETPDIVVSLHTGGTTDRLQASGYKTSVSYKVTVATDGFYFLLGSVKFTSADTTLKLTAIDESGNTVYTVDAITAANSYVNPADKTDGSTGVNILGQYGYAYFAAGEYTVTVDYVSGDYALINSLYLALNTHVHNYVTTTVAPTCQTGGYTAEICTCGDIQNKRGEISAGGHVLSDWVIVEATESTTGSMTRSCTLCGEGKEEIVLKTLANKTETVTLPTGTATTTATVTVVNAGIYKVTYSGDNNFKGSYPYLYNKTLALNATTQNRVTDPQNNFHYIYLQAGANELELKSFSGTADLCGATFTLLNSEAVEGIAANLGTQLGNADNAKNDLVYSSYSTGETLVLSGGAYRLYGFANNGTMKTVTISVLNEAGEVAAQIVYDFSKGDTCTMAGSTGTTKYQDFGLVYLPAGNYTVKADIGDEADTGGTYINIGSIFFSNANYVEGEEPDPGETPDPGPGETPDPEQHDPEQPEQPGDHTCTFGDWVITEPTAEANGSAVRSCTDDTCDKTETLILTRAPLSTDAVTIGTITQVEDNGKKAYDIAVNAPLAGFYRIEMAASFNATKQYASVYNTKYGVGTASMNRANAGTGYALYVLLDAGDNTIRMNKWDNALADLTNVPTAENMTFSMVSGDMPTLTAVVDNTLAGKHLSTSGAKQSYSFTVTEAGFYYLQSIFSMNKGTAVTATFTVSVGETELVTKVYTSGTDPYVIVPTDVADGSSGTRLLSEIGLYYFEAGEYTVTVTSGGNYVRAGATFLSKITATDPNGSEEPDPGETPDPGPGETPDPEQPDPEQPEQPGDHTCTFGDWVITEPTADANGSAVRSCTDDTCDKTETKVIAARGDFTSTEPISVASATAHADTKNYANTWVYSVTAPTAGFYRVVIPNVTKNAYGYYGVYNTAYTLQSASSNRAKDATSSYAVYVYLNQGENTVHFWSQTKADPGAATFTQVTKEEMVQMVGIGSQTFVANNTGAGQKLTTTATKHSFEVTESGFYYLSGMMMLQNKGTGVTVSIVGTDLSKTYTATDANGQPGSIASVINAFDMGDGSTGNRGVLFEHGLVYLEKGTTYEIEIKSNGSNWATYGSFFITKAVVTDPAE